MDVNTGKLIRLFTGNDLVLFHIDYSSEGNSIVSYGYDGNYHRVKVWDVNTGNMIKSYQAGSDSSQRHHVA
jgi:WD40 repeat protein